MEIQINSKIMDSKLCTYLPIFTDQIVLTQKKTQVSKRDFFLLLKNIIELNWEFTLRSERPVCMWTIHSHTLANNILIESVLHSVPNVIFLQAPEFSG